MVEGVKGGGTGGGTCGAGVGRVIGEVVMVPCHQTPCNDDKIGGPLNKTWKEEECRRAGMEE